MAFSRDETVPLTGEVKMTSKCPKNKTTDHSPFKIIVAYSEQVSEPLLRLGLGGGLCFLIEKKQTRFR